MKKNLSLNVDAKKIYKQKLVAKITKVAFLLLIVTFTIVYFLLYVLYSKGNFTVSLDNNAANLKNIFLSENGSYENLSVELKADPIDYMDNISINWIPTDIDTKSDGSHNGTNYIAYSFYVMNCGQENVDYWYQIDIMDSIKKVDSAVRIMIYRNGEKIVYAKKNGTTNNEESGTVSFKTDDIAVLENVKDFAPGKKDRFTVVIWLEGDDPDCVDDIIGGEIKLQMNITEEHTSA